MLTQRQSRREQKSSNGKKNARSRPVCCAKRNKKNKRSRQPQTMLHDCGPAIKQLFCRLFLYFFQASEARSCTCVSASAESLPSTPPSQPIISVDKSWKTV